MAAVQLALHSRPPADLARAQTTSTQELHRLSAIPPTHIEIPTPAVDALLCRHDWTQVQWE